jgi:hypothetical protein
MEERACIFRIAPQERLSRCFTYGTRNVRCRESVWIQAVFQWRMIVVPQFYKSVEYNGQNTTRPFLFAGLPRRNRAKITSKQMKITLKQMEG